MKARVQLFLPSHHEDHVSVESDHVYCQDGTMYDVVEDDLDLDELEEWKADRLDYRLMLIILVDIKHFEFEFKSTGSIVDGVLATSIDEVEITDVNVPGINTAFADVATDNDVFEAYLYKLLGSR